MSNNAHRNPTRRADLRAAAINADYGIDSSSLDGLLADYWEETDEMAALHARLDRRANDERSPWYLPSEDRYHLSSAGLIALLKPAIEAVWGDRTAESYGTFHSQFGWTIHLGGRFQRDLHHRDYHGGDGFYLRLAEGKTVLEEAARIAGFLHAFAEAENSDADPDWWRPMRKWLNTLVYWTRRKAVWGSGIGEPEKAIMGAIRVSGGPGAFNRRMRMCARLVREHMRAWGRPESEKVSWANIAHGLIVTSGRLNKAAVIAVANHLYDGYAKIVSYREAREWLTKLHLCNVADNSDGVESRREAEPRLTKLGVNVYRTAVPVVSPHGYQVGFGFSFLVRSADGRTYHSDWGSPMEALHQALRAWKEQDKLAALEADFIGFLRGDEGFCPLVMRSDSYSAGNCESGTEAWLRERGWANREFIPAAWLIPHLAYGLVRNVAANLYRRHTEQRDAA